MICNQTSISEDEIELVLRPSASKHTSRETSPPSKFTVVNTKHQGKRILIAQEVIEKIGSPSTVQIAFFGDGVAIGQDLGFDENLFHLRNSGNKYVIYSSELVVEITETFNFDFTRKTSISYSNIKYLDFKDKLTALVTIGASLQDTTVNKSDSEQQNLETEATTEYEHLDSALDELEFNRFDSNES